MPADYCPKCGIDHRPRSGCAGMPKSPIYTVTDPREKALAMLWELRSNMLRTKIEIKKLRATLRGAEKEETRLLNEISKLGGINPPPED